MSVALKIKRCWLSLLLILVRIPEKQYGFRKRTAAAKLKVQLQLVEERLELIVRISIPIASV